MKSKKPLLVVTFLAILLVLLIVVPTVAFAAPGGSGGGKPVNWASFVCDSNNDFPDFPTMDAIHVQQLPDGTVRGKYLDQFTGKPGGESDYRFSSRNFTSVYWDAFHGPSAACLGQLDASAARTLCGRAARNAEVADFVVYVPADQLPPGLAAAPPDGGGLAALRYVLLDFGEPGAGNDLYAA